MSKKKDDSGGGHLAVTLATAGGVFMLRKVLAVVWTKVTGKEPPTDLTDPGVSLPEALSWAVTTAVIIEVARFGIIRATRRKSAGQAPAAVTAEPD
jgi:Protein of unknown function (DUF4235)